MRNLTVTALAACLAATPAAGQDSHSEIDAIFEAIGAEDPGCALGVARPGEPAFVRTYGLADLEREVPIGADTVFDIGSVQKQFVAAAVLMLAEDGRLSLADDVRAHLPDMADTGHRITIEHLLTHTSGIRDWTALMPLSENGADVLDVILRQEGLNFAPGEEWSYSNSNYVLLKEIVERVSGTSFAQFADERLFDRLGMASTAYLPDILAAEGPRALGYRRAETGWTPYMRLGSDRGGGAIVSTPGDLLIWNAALTEGRLGEFVTRTLEAPARLNNGRTLTYAYGLNVEHVPGERLVSHSGGAAGYSAWLGRFTESGLSIAVLCAFEPVSATALAYRVSDRFLPPIDSQATPPGPVAAQGVDVAGRDGLFIEEGGGTPLVLIAREGRLGIAGAGPLTPVSADRFQPARADLRFRSEDAFTLVFISNDLLELISMEGEVTRYHRAQAWTPSAADLRAIEGRYFSHDLNRAFELEPHESGMAFRFESSPERSIPLEPVARDLFMHGPSTAVVRLRRDAAGRVTGFDYSNTAIRGLSLVRTQDDRDVTAGGAPPPD